jgi:hypothetical protein
VIWVAPRLPEVTLENGPKTASQSRKPKCFCGTRQSRNYASLSPCASGTPGESGWPGQTNGASTANLSNGANQDSFSPGQTALPWAEQPCTTLCDDSAWQESAAAAASPSLRKRSEPLSSVGILSVKRLAPSKGSPRVPRRSNSRLSRREASLLVLSKGSSQNLFQNVR